MQSSKIVDAALLASVSASAAAAARRRMNHNLHAMDDAIHRLLNATEPGTYVQPHRHMAVPKCETLLVLRGRGAVVRFDDAGAPSEVHVLSPEGPVHVLELPPAAWHTLIALEPGTVWFEVKAGPYEPIPPADIAPWAPAPGDAEAPAYLASLRALCR